MSNREEGRKSRWPDARVLSRRIRLGLLVLILLTLAWNLRHYRLHRVPPGEAGMSPACNPGERLVLYRHGDWVYRPGDMLQVTLPGQGPALLRLLAQDRGVVAIANGRLLVDGTPDLRIVARFPAGFTKTFPPLAPGEVFLVADNQLASRIEDSLVRGAWKKDTLAVDGKVFLALGSSP